MFHGLVKYSNMYLSMKLPKIEITKLLRIFELLTFRPCDYLILSKSLSYLLILSGHSHMSQSQIQTSHMIYHMTADSSMTSALTHALTHKTLFYSIPFHSFLYYSLHIYSIPFKSNTYFNGNSCYGYGSRAVVVRLIISRVYKGSLCSR
jgi:hypothetical protein